MKRAAVLPVSRPIFFFLYEFIYFYLFITFNIKASGWLSGRFFYYYFSERNFIHFSQFSAIFYTTLRTNSKRSLHYPVFIYIYIYIYIYCKHLFSYCLSKNPHQPARLPSLFLPEYRLRLTRYLFGPPSSPPCHHPYV